MKKLLMLFTFLMVLSFSLQAQEGNAKTNHYRSAGDRDCEGFFC